MTQHQNRRLVTENRQLIHRLRNKIVVLEGVIGILADGIKKADKEDPITGVLFSFREVERAINIVTKGAYTRDGRPINVNKGLADLLQARMDKARGFENCDLVKAREDMKKAASTKASRQ